MPESFDSPQTRIVLKPETNHARHTVVGTLQGFAAEALRLPTGLLTAAFLTRQIGPEGYGLLTVAVSIVVWIEVTIALGFSRTAVKFVAEAMDWQAVASRLVQAQLLVSLGAAALLIVVAPALASWLGAPELATYLRLFALDIPIFTLGNIHRSILIGRGYFGRRALLSASYWLSRMVLVFMFVGLGLSITGAILASIGASVVVLIGARVSVRPALLGPSTLRQAQDPALPFRSLWNYAVLVSLYHVGISLFKKLDLLFVTALNVTSQAASFYGAAQNLTIVSGLFAASFSPLLLAKLSQLSRQGQEAPARTMTRQVMRLVLCLLPFAGMVAGAAPEVVVAIYGRPFLPAGPLLALLIFAALGLTMISVTTTILIAAGRPGLTFALTGPLVLLALGAHFVLVRRFGPSGAAAATTGLAWLGAGAMMLAVHRIWQVLPPAATLGRSTLICVIAYAVAAIWPAPGFLLLLKLPTIGLVILLGYLWLGEFNAGEIALARSLLRRQTVPEQDPREV